ncbi:trichohyalin-like [Venturia canescens]|uniref:trichohyalin-like n=1 Tax=Venturia canescens TaxID=32260 RepID=UPI001C9D1FD4|nr:trichohyalin-like [Venturia canescens]
MSVVPLQISGDSKATRKPRDPRGTANIPYGYRLSQQKQTCANINLTTSEEPRSSAADTRIKYQADHAKQESTKSKGETTKNEQAENLRSGDPTVKSDLKEAVQPGESVVQNQQEELKGSRTSTKIEHGKSVIGKDLRHRDKRRSMRNGKQSQGEEVHVGILPVNLNAEKDENKEREERELISFLRTNDFVEKTDKRIRKEKIRSLIDEGLTEYEQSINARREKLRALLLAEEKSWIREVVEQAQRGSDLRIEEAQKRTIELRKLAEEQRLETVKEKRMRQYLERCPEVRDRLTKKTTLETKYANLMQMADNEAKRQAEREENMLWYDLMLREIEAKKARELEEARRRMDERMSLVVVLEKQMARKSASADEKGIEEEGGSENQENPILEETIDPVKVREKRAQLKKELDEQLTITRRYLADRAREEEAVDNALRILNEKELARERATSKETVSRLRNEIAAYMASLEEFRREETQRNAEIEGIVAATAREVERKRDSARRELREKRERIFRGVLEGREQQLREKRVREEEENKRSVLDDELRRKQTEAEASLEAEAEMRRRENALRYGQELKAQQKSAEEMRRRKDEEIERMLRDNLEREKEYEKLAEQMLNAPEIITPHAFKILLRECAARREAKQKDLCYDSRSLTQLQPTPPTGHP